MLFGGGVVIKVGDEVIGGIGAAGAPGAKLDDNYARRSRQDSPSVAVIGRQGR
jgi:uncharacterized protein GlcG (DUF336 family)